MLLARIRLVFRMSPLHLAILASSTPWLLWQVRQVVPPLRDIRLDWSAGESRQGSCVSHVVGCDESSEVGTAIPGALEGPALDKASGCLVLLPCRRLWSSWRIPESSGSTGSLAVNMVDVRQATTVPAARCGGCTAREAEPNSRTIWVPSKIH